MSLLGGRRRLGFNHSSYPSTFSRKRLVSMFRASWHTGRTDLVAETPCARKDRSPPAGRCPFRVARPTCPPHELLPRSYAIATPRPRATGRVYMRLTSAQSSKIATAAPDREAVPPHHKEAYIRLEQLLDRKAVTLMRLIGGTEHVVQFADQVMHLRRCLDRSLDCDVHCLASGTHATSDSGSASRMSWASSTRSAPANLPPTGIRSQRNGTDDLGSAVAGQLRCRSFR
jgi:hypothetical protein